MVFALSAADFDVRDIRFSNVHKKNSLQITPAHSNGRPGEHYL